MKKRQVGGQGLLNGIIMDGKFGIAKAIRKKDGRIDLRLNKRSINTQNKSLRSFPFFRGFYILKKSINTGVNGLNVSEDVLKEILTVSQIRKISKKLKISRKKLSSLAVIIMATFISFIGFLIIPTSIRYLINHFIEINNNLLGVVEGIITLLILVIYLYSLGKNKDIIEMFKYHGAEHKTIHCYENRKKLNIDNVKNESRFHIRCGTNLLFMIFILYGVANIFLPYNSMFFRVVLKVLVIPIIVSVSYEIINLIARYDNIIFRLLALPGLELQRLTTREPDNEHIEVAILAIRKAEGLRVEKTIRELLNDANKTFKEAGIESYILDAQLLMCHILDKNKLWLMMNEQDRIGFEKEEEFKTLVEKRKNKYPMNYILGNAEFMGIDFIVEEGVLIPRPDTEILVEEVLKHIEKHEELEVCDLCCGSGAIGLAIASYRDSTTVDLLDIDKTPEKVTKLNIESLELSDRARFIHSDLFANASNKGYDIIVSNPPYIREEVIETLMDDVKNYEPHLALSGGEDGLIFYRQITKDSVNLLKGKKILAFEIGHDQGEDVKAIMENNGFQNVAIIKDLAGLDRVVIGNLIIE